jgi:hypothetical protein
MGKLRMLLEMQGLRIPKVLVFVVVLPGIVQMVRIAVLQYRVIIVVFEIDIVIIVVVIMIVFVVVW